MTHNKEKHGMSVKKKIIGKRIVTINKRENNAKEEF